MKLYEVWRYDTVLKTEKKMAEYADRYTAEVAVESLSATWEVVKGFTYYIKEVDNGET